MIISHRPCLKHRSQCSSHTTNEQYLLGRICQGIFDDFGQETDVTHLIPDILLSQVVNVKLELAVFTLTTPVPIHSHIGTPTFRAIYIVHVRIIVIVVRIIVPLCTSLIHIGSYPIPQLREILCYQCYQAESNQSDNDYVCHSYFVFTFFQTIYFPVPPASLQPMPLDRWLTRPTLSFSHAFDGDLPFLCQIICIYSFKVCH